MHPIPYKLLDINVLIGAELWNKIETSEDIYYELIYIFEKVREVYTKRIREEYLEYNQKLKNSFKSNYISKYIEGKNL